MFEKYLTTFPNLNNDDCVHNVGPVKSNVYIKINEASWIQNIFNLIQIARAIILFISMSKYCLALVSKQILFDEKRLRKHLQNEYKLHTRCEIHICGGCFEISARNIIWTATLGALIWSFYRLKQISLILWSSVVYLGSILFSFTWLVYLKVQDINL